MDANVPFLSSESWDEHMPERTRWLRQNDPVHWSEPDGVWLISKFADVAAVSKDQDLFTSAHGVRPGSPARIGLIDAGEPHHGQLRGLINRGFTPRTVRRLETIFRGLVTECIDRVAVQGECDFVESIAVPLPLLVIAEMIGIRKEDRERFRRWSDAMITADGRHDEPEIMAKIREVVFANFGPDSPLAEGQPAYILDIAIKAATQTVAELREDMAAMDARILELRGTLDPDEIAKQNETIERVRRILRDHRPKYRGQNRLTCLL